MKEKNVRRCMSMFQEGVVDFTIVTDTEDKELIKTMIYALIDDIEKEGNSKNVIYNIQLTLQM